MWVRRLLRLASVADPPATPPGAGRDDVPAAPPRFPSLPLILEETRRSIDAHDRRASGLDQRGGVLVGFAGVLVSVVIDDTGGWDAVIGALLAAAAAVVAAYAISMRVANSVAPAGLTRYASEPLESTQAAVAASMVLVHREQAAALGRKARALAVSSVLLVAAVTVLVAGMVVRSNLIPETIRWTEEVLR